MRRILKAHFAIVVSNWLAVLICCNIYVYARLFVHRLNKTSVDICINVFRYTQLFERSQLFNRVRIHDWIIVNVEFVTWTSLRMAQTEPKRSILLLRVNIIASDVIRQIWNTINIHESNSIKCYFTIKYNYCTIFRNFNKRLYIYIYI